MNARLALLLPRSVQRRLATLRAERYVAKHGLHELEVLPADALKVVQRKALLHLLQRRNRDHLGDYLDFGGGGGAVRCMYQVMQELRIYPPRLFGIGLLAGKPARFDDPSPGNFELTRAILRRQGVDMQRVQLAELRDTLQPTFRAKHQLTRASVVRIDGALYASTVEALRFVEPLIVGEVAFFFDDWSANELAMSQFLARHPDLSIEPFDSYAPHAACFLVRRAQF